MFPRKGTCFFVTSICGSSSQASRRVVRKAAGKSQYAGSSIQEALGIPKLLPRDVESQLLPCLARGEPVLPRVWGWQNWGCSSGSLRLWEEGLSQPLSGCSSPSAAFVFPMAFPWRDSGKFRPRPLLHLCYVLSLSLLGWWRSPRDQQPSLSSFSSSRRICPRCVCALRGSGWVILLILPTESFLVGLFIHFWVFITQPVSGSVSWHLRPRFEVFSLGVRLKPQVCSRGLTEPSGELGPALEPSVPCLLTGSVSALTASLHLCWGTGERRAPARCRLCLLRSRQRFRRLRERDARGGSGGRQLWLKAGAPGCPIPGCSLPCCVCVSLTFLRVCSVTGKEQVL